MTVLLLFVQRLSEKLSCQKSAVAWQWIRPSFSGQLWCKRPSRAQFCVSAGWDESIPTSERCWGHESYLWDASEREMSKLGALAGGTRQSQGLIAGCAPGQTGGENPVLFYWIRIFRWMFYWLTWQLHLSAKNWVHTLSNHIGEAALMTSFSSHMSKMNRTEPEFREGHLVITTIRLPLVCFPSSGTAHFSPSVSNESKVPHTSQLPGLSGLGSYPGKKNLNETTLFMLCDLKLEQI